MCVCTSRWPIRPYHRLTVPGIVTLTNMQTSAAFTATAVRENFSATVTASLGSDDVRSHWIFSFSGKVNGGSVDMKMHIRLKRDGTYRYDAQGTGFELTGTTNPVPVELT